mgnify:CR=1 FL=1
MAIREARGKSRTNEIFKDKVEKKFDIKQIGRAQYIKLKEVNK